MCENIPIKEEITSFSNQYIKFAASLQNKKIRKREQQYLIEGKTLVFEALRRGIKFKLVFSHLDEELDALPELVEAKIFKLNEELMQKISSTSSAPEIIAIAENAATRIAETQKQQQQIFLYCDQLQDPGNLGSIIRTAFAAGVSKIYLSEQSIDIYSPKVVRSSMGAIWAGEIIYKDFNACLEELKQTNTALEILGTSSHLGVNYYEYKFENSCDLLLVVGNEGRGMSEEISSKCTNFLQIPMSNEIESINVLSATSIILFELKKQF